MNTMHTIQHEGQLLTFSYVTFARLLSPLCDMQHNLFFPLSTLLNSESMQKETRGLKKRLIQHVYYGSKICCLKAISYTENIFFLLLYLVTHDFTSYIIITDIIISYIRSYIINFRFYYKKIL